MTTEPDQTPTTVGNHFVSNYPPFSFWKTEWAPRVDELLASEAEGNIPLGIYLHIPFCRKRCDFCYFRVYTDKNSDAIRRYLDALIAEMGLYARQPHIRGRKPRFIYFGGGTPSYLSVDQLTYLFDGLRRHFDLDEVEETTFECEPGTLQEPKIRALRKLGVTRLSLGVENFDPEILTLNNRAHRAKEIFTAYNAAQEIGFPQINIDLIAGMVGETEENWQDCIAKTRTMAPESVTLYQMEVPYNTTVYQRMKNGGKQTAPIADWQTKRRWVDAGFGALEADGYRIGSAYTAVKNSDVTFAYRDGLWHGADMLGLGVASFSHLGGMHFQNSHDFDPYIEMIETGKLPIHRALALSDDEKLIREFILQLKIGQVELSYFRNKFGIDPKERFADALAKHQRSDFLEVAEDRIILSRDGLLQVDVLLSEFFRPEHMHARYA